MGISPMSAHDRVPSLTKILAIWLTPQLLSLLLSAARVPLSAHPPQPIESIALEQMIITQIIAAALLAPWLFGSITSIIAVALAGAPILQLAGFLSSAALSQLIALYALLVAWLVALGGAISQMTQRNRFLLAAFATAWCAGGLIVAYLQSEFAPERSLPATFFGPAYVALRSPQGHVGLTTALATLGVIGGYVGKRMRGATISTS